MDIIKNLKDYNLSQKQRIFAGYIKDSIDSFACCEKITNRRAIMSYVIPEPVDFTIYTTAIAEPALLIRRAIAG